MFLTKSFLILAVFWGAFSSNYAKSDTYANNRISCENALRRAKRRIQIKKQRAELESSDTPWGNRSRIRVMTYNMLNLFAHRRRVDELTDSYSQRPIKYVRKNKGKRKKQAKIIKEISPDIAVLQEIEATRDRTAFQNLEAFAEKDLNDEYVPLMAKNTNDHRGLWIGFLIKTELIQNYDFEILSFADRTWVNPNDMYVWDKKRNPTSKIYHGPVFARDFPILLVKHKLETEPFAAFAGVHLKSQRDPPKNSSNDKGARKRAAREVKEIISIVNGFREEYPDIPLTISGDFNADIRSHAMFNPLLDLGFKDSIHHHNKNQKGQARRTSYFFNNDKLRPLGQLDSHLLDENIQKNLISTWIEQYKNRRGQVVVPDSPKMREKVLPSDHLPVVVDIKTDAWKRKNP